MSGLESRTIRVNIICSTWNIVDYVESDYEAAKKKKGFIGLDKLIPPPDVEPEAWDYHSCLLLADVRIEIADLFYENKPFDDVIWQLSLKNTVGYSLNGT